MVNLRLSGTERRELDDFYVRLVESWGEHPPEYGPKAMGFALRALNRI